MMQLLEITGTWLMIVVVCLGAYVVFWHGGRSED